MAHYHKTYAEHFEVLEGVLEVMVGGGTRALRPGEKAVAPKNTLHDFRNPTGEPATFLVELRPGSAGFEKALKAGYGLAADGLTRADGTPKYLYYLAVLLEWSDMRLPGIFTAPSRCSAPWRNAPGVRGSTGSWRRDTADDAGSGERPVALVLRGSEKPEALPHAERTRHRPYPIRGIGYG